MSDAKPRQTIRETLPVRLRERQVQVGRDRLQRPRRLRRRLRRETLLRLQLVSCSFYLYRRGRRQRCYENCDDYDCLMV